MILFMFHLRSRIVRAETFHPIDKAHDGSSRTSRDVVYYSLRNEPMGVDSYINHWHQSDEFVFFFQLKTNLRLPRAHPLIHPLCRHFTLLCCVWVFHCLLLGCWLVPRGCTPNCGCLKVFQDDLDDSLPQGVNLSARKCP